MSAQGLEQRARELLAAEYERDGRPSDADFLSVGLPVCDTDIRALRAIVAALRQKPAPVDLEAAGWIHEDELPGSYPYDAMFPFSKVDGVRMFPVYMPTIQPAPAIIDNAGGVECSEVSGYIATVPDKCDRIIWRGQYHHLSPHQPAPVVDDAMVVERMAVWIAHLEAFIGPSAIPTLRASLAEGRPPGGAAHARAQEVQS